VLEFINIFADRRELRVVDAGRLETGVERCGPPMTAGRGVDDKRVQPRADGKPGTARGLPGGFTDLGTNSF